MRANDKRRARTCRHPAHPAALPYDGRDLDAIGKEDTKIIGEGPSFLEDRPEALPRAPKDARHDSGCSRHSAE